MPRDRDNITRGGRSTSTSSKAYSTSRGRGRGAASSSSNLPAIKSSNPFDQERSENAAKREERENRGQQNGILSGRGGRGSSRGRSTTKAVRFASPPEEEQKHASTAAHSKPLFGSPGAGTQYSQAPLNPFDQPLPPSPQADVTQRNPFAPPRSSTPQSGLFSNPVASSASTSITFRTPSIFAPANPFKPETNSAPPSEQKPFGAATIFGSSRSMSNRTAKNTQNDGSQLHPLPQQVPSGPLADIKNRSQAKITKSKLGVEISEALRKNGIFAPSWPTSVPGDPNWKAAMEAFWHTTKAYRARVRTYLMQNKLLDDPDKPKKLSDAIDFRGTCEEMCPEFEKITRIIEQAVHKAESELSSDGKTYWPVLDKMIKANARSAAGQDAPLPEDVRTPAALRRTLDYLIDVALGTSDLPKVHGFLWDRTRSIRRDFVFQQASMTGDELSDQVYCLELIARFHVVALHQMSHEDVVADDFSEQQEVEQLGKTLLSLIHTYEDCMAQGIYCENEAEFRAYYVLFNIQDTSILEAVQDWGWRNWGESDEIRTAISLVEALQNIWDPHGPLKPSATEIALNAYSRYFNILYDRTVSYTMACFAEIHLNRVRKAALKTILAAYRKQRDQTRDWSLRELNQYLHFDDEIDILEFGEAYGLHFEVVDGQTCLSFASEDSVSDPFPRLKQPHSYNLVERKRGSFSLLEAIHETIYEPLDESEDENSLFISGSAATSNTDVATPPSPIPTEPPDPLNENTTINENTIGENTQSDISITEILGQDKPLFSSETQIPPILAPLATPIDSNFSYQGTSDSVKTGEAVKSSIFDKKSAVPEGGIFSFLNPPKASDSIVPAATVLQPTATPTLFSLPKEAPTESQSAIQPATPPATSAIAEKAHTSSLVDEPVPKSLEVEGPQIPSFAGSTIHETHGPTDGPSINPHEKSISHNTIEIIPPESRMSGFAKWVAFGRGGLFDQFTEFKVEEILIQTVKDHVAEEKRKREQEEEIKSLEEAARFRSRELATKYGYRWRELAHRLWMKRKGRQAREARRQMAQESFRTSKDAKSRDPTQGARLSRRAHRRHSADQAPVHKEHPNKASHLENKTRKPYGENRKIGSSSPPPPNHSEGYSHMTNGSSMRRSNHSRGESDVSLRKSLLSESAYLQGGSRIYLLPDDILNAKGQRQPDGVKTDYFRLKTGGAMTLPYSSPPAIIARVNVPEQETYMSDISNLTTAQKSNRMTRRMNIPAKALPRGAISLGGSEVREDDIEATKTRARAILKQDKDKKQKSKKRTLDSDDEELFAKAKRIREQMDEGTEWFKAEVQKSLSSSLS